MKSQYLVITMVAAILLLANCSNEKESWEQLPSTPITGADATITFNGERSYGIVTLDAQSATKGLLTLDNVIPGYALEEVNVTLDEKTDGSFAVDGSKMLMNPPVIMPISRAEASPTGIYELKATGVVTKEGKAFIDITTALTTEAGSSMAGRWMPENMLPVAMPYLSHSPAVVSVTLAGKPTESAELSTKLSLAAGAIIYNVIGAVELASDGNLTVEYSPEIDAEKIIAEGINEAAGEYADMKLPKLASAKNMIFWYATGEMLSISPIVPKIIYQVAVDKGENPNLNDGATTEKTEKLIADLAAKGVDTASLLKMLNELNSTGIPMGLKHEGNNMSIIITKEMVDPIITLLSPALPSLGINELEELGKVWQEVTDFSLTLNFSC
ncbi:MAG: DUF4925 domain-containing protein [Lachnoclostridium sp.]|nr:DUF4925 domain-containing protein [Lachnoclostridium sp.]